MANEHAIRSGAPIRLSGVRTHNLKGINLEIPIGSITVITGRSGAGKSSLVLDTLFAEGQRRYVESLSVYTRQFLERMDRPDVDGIQGILPAIAIRQHSYAKNPRSTVGTVTEIYDYLRLLFARSAKYRCPDCGELITEDTPQSVWERLLALTEGNWVTVLAPVIPDAEDPIGQMQKLIGYGFIEMYEADQRVDIREIPPREWANCPERWIWLARRRIERERRDAWIDLLETGFAVGFGHLAIVLPDGERLYFSESLDCPKDRRKFPPLEPVLFSFNRPEGACPDCQGFGDVADIDWNKVVPNQDLSLRNHPIQPWNSPGLRHIYKYLYRAAQKSGWDLDTPWKDLPETVREAILHGNDNFWGLDYFFNRLKKKRYKRGVRIFLARYRRYRPCSTCRGTRLRPETAWAEINGVTLPSLVKWPINKIWEWVNSLELTESQRHMLARVLEELEHRLGYLMEVGLGYLTLERTAGSLSGGEAQRIQMAVALGTALSNTLFVLDEPSAGQHPRDLKRLSRILHELKKRGNTVVVVEHDPDLMQEADLIMELGPGGGEDGGHMIASGTPKEICTNPDSLTGRWLKKHRQGASRIRPWRTPRGFVSIRGAKVFNLKGIDVDIPMGCFTAITGVSGSGKSTLLAQVLWPAIRSKLRGTPFPDKNWKEIRIDGDLEHVLYVDASPPARTPRATVASYLQFLPDLRRWFIEASDAERFHMTPADLSWNSNRGRCPTCRGLGFRRVEMIFISDVTITCETCHGARLRPEVLKARWNDRTFYDLLCMSVETLGRNLPRSRKLESTLRAVQALQDMELAYLSPARSLVDLSGGEIQRLKLAKVLAEKKLKPTLFLFDEPTIGLHPVEIEKFVQALERLLEHGHSVTVVEHNLNLVANADYIVDLGPEGGDAGGMVVDSGFLSELLRKRDSGSYTMKFLRTFCRNSSYRRSLP